MITCALLKVWNVVISDLSSTIHGRWLKLGSVKLETLITDGWKDYALIDSGHGRKLEKMAGHLINRPEPQAMWTPHLDEAEWEKADAIFMGSDGEDEGVHGRWQNSGIQNGTWQTEFEKIKFVGQLTNFRHVGYFPEQCAHWDWLAAQTKPSMKILNLFAYSGVHSLIGAAKGAEVTHVDASKKAITWAKENQDLNDPSWKIRWVVEDAVKFVAREAKRGNVYDGIVLDPPKFGRGPNNETWDLFEDLPPLLAECTKILKPQKGSFVLLTSYAIRASAMAFGQLAAEYFDGTIETGELFVREQKTKRLLPTSMYTRVVI
jgi:23S rRNA (cytosine1962-C5)-methyltransferase